MHIPLSCTLQAFCRLRWVCTLLGQHRAEPLCADLGECGELKKGWALRTIDFSGAGSRGNCKSIKTQMVWHALVVQRAWRKVLTT